MRNHILIVRHGPNRGRLARYCQHVLDWLADARPELAARVRLHETGTGPADMAGVGAVVFWLADPLNLYADCRLEASAIEQEALRLGLPVMNRPSVLAAYGKAYQAERWRRAGVPVPPATSFRDAEELRSFAERVGYPVLVRGDRSFSPDEIVIVPRGKRLRSLDPHRLPPDPVASALIDVRQGYRAARPGSVWARLYHRKRSLVIGRQVVADSLFFSTCPIVRLRTSLYGRAARRQKILRRWGRAGRRAAALVPRTRRLREILRLEQEFVHSPLPEADVLRRATAALELDFVAFDYASLADGTVLLWEANPHPFIPPAHHIPLRLARSAAAKMRGVYEGFADGFASLLD